MNLFSLRRTLLFILALGCGQPALADSITVSETWKDNTSGGYYSASADSGTFSASLTIPGLSSLTAADWHNLQVTIDSDPLVTSDDGSFSDVMANASSHSSTSATFYFQAAATNGSLVNAFKLAFSRSGNVLTITGQTLNPAAVQPPWSIAAWNFFDQSGVAGTTITTNPVACEILVLDSLSNQIYADISRTLYLVATNAVSLDSGGMALNNIRVSGAADLTPPTLSAVSPTVSATVSNALLNVQARATDSFGVANVEFYVNGQDYGSGLFDGTNQWSMLFALDPGSNVIKTVATDVNGNNSATNSLAMTYVNRQTNASQLTFAERWQEGVGVTDNDLIWSQDAGVINAAWQVAGLQAIPSSTWSNLTLGLRFGNVTLQRRLGEASILTSSNAAFFITTNTCSYDVRIARAGDTLTLVVNGYFIPGFTSALVGLSGVSSHAAPFEMDLSAGATRYSSAAATVYFSGTNVVAQDDFGNSLNNIRLAGSADYQPPTNQIVAPTANQRLTNALAYVRGTARDDRAVAGVWCQLNGAEWKPASTTNNWSDWNTTLPLIAGTNTLSAYAVDLDGNASPTSSVSFFSSNTFVLELDFDPATPPGSNGLALTLRRSPNIDGHLEYSTNLRDWATWTNFVGPDTGLIFLDPAAANSPNRFYRAVIP